MDSGESKYVIVAGTTPDPKLTDTNPAPPDKSVSVVAFHIDAVAVPPPVISNVPDTMIKIFEYMAFGLPVVLFDLKEGRRAAGHAALYATPNDTRDFSNQITRLLNSKELRDKLGNCGRKQIEEKLNWENEQTSLLQAYETALQYGYTVEVPDRNDASKKFT